MSGKIILLSAGSATAAVGGISTFFYLFQRETIKSKVEKSGIKLIKYEDLLSWKTAFKGLKSKSEVIEELKKIDPSIADVSDLDKGGNALKSFCKTSWERPYKPGEQFFLQVKEWCIQVPLTVKDQFLGSRKTLENNWESKFEAIKTSNTNQLKEDLKAIDNQITKELTDNEDKNKFVAALQKWCEDNLNKNLIEADSILEKAKHRCLKNDN
ncbi:hypothetical protein MHC_00865 [Mycoplasma haemocanis str. Illinois]|uniref:Uncharacterized protein n=1 Tax=Mycoplasma haemocanis (strain Illinois) TaxID=1111676 RepID=H6N5S9_MYCHN|nr:hypothetical protein [Mycoplasma haemocanis]AEW45039.1 hypothetical protein MHC_00865 [Mycoplasma haemocanis str. Illinois]